MRIKLNKYKYYNWWSFLRRWRLYCKVSCREILYYWTCAHTSKISVKDYISGWWKFILLCYIRGGMVMMNLRTNGRSASWWSLRGFYVVLEVNGDLSHVQILTSSFCNSMIRIFIKYLKSHQVSRCTITPFWHKICDPVFSLLWSTYISGNDS